MRFDYYPRLRVPRCAPRLHAAAMRRRERRESLGRFLCHLGLHKWTRWGQGHTVAFLLAGLEPTLCCNWRRCKREGCEAEDFD